MAKKDKLPKAQDVPETERILPKTPNRAHTEMKSTSPRAGAKQQSNSNE